MRRFFVLPLLVAAMSASVLVAGASRAAACTTSGQFTTCQYVNQAFLPPNQTHYSPWNYWYTNKMWRQAPAWVAISFDNASACCAGYTLVYSDNPAVTRGSYGYDQGFCANADTFTENSVTCQVYNWNT